MRRILMSSAAVLLTGALSVQAATSLPRLLSAELGPAPWNVQSGGITAYDVQVDEEGNVAGAEVVQDFDPYGAILGEAVRTWRFEPAREDGRAVASRVLVIGFFRPPGMNFPAPERPRYKDTVAPDEIPWPTSVAVPPYPANALGSGKVILEVDVSDSGAVVGTRVLTASTPFDGAAAQAAQKWAFRPAQKGNRAVASRAFLVFSFVGLTP
jgi:TonB family protein